MTPPLLLLRAGLVPDVLASKLGGSGEVSCLLDRGTERFRVPRLSRRMGFAAGSYHPADRKDQAGGLREVADPPCGGARDMSTALPYLSGWHRLTWPGSRSAPFWMVPANPPWIEAHWTPEDASREEPPLMRLTMNGLQAFQIALEPCSDPRSARFDG